MDKERPVYYARSKSKTGEMQKVCEHLNSVSALCRRNLEALNCAEAGEILGKFHDFGKYSDRFADVLAHRKQNVNHAFPGAAFLWMCYHRKYCVETGILATVVMSHHGSIRPFSSDAAGKCMNGTDRYDSTGKEYSLFGKEDFMQSTAVFKEEIPLPPKIFSIPFSAGKYSDSFDRMLEKMLCVRMLLSALADADYSDAAAAFDHEYLKKTVDVPLDAQTAMQRLLALRLEKQRNSNANGDIDALRTKLFDDCLEAGKGAPGLYTLNAPTGLGKTLSLMAFALCHCQAHPQMRRIILILPFLAIAKQNVVDYRRIFPEILESHSAAEWTEDMRFLSERWSVPCIVTTNVGFFEPLFADSAANVRRLHQIAGSVIVLDEAQSLPPTLLDATLKTIRSLCENYGCTFVFSTATQPHFASRPGLCGNWNPQEIVPNPQSLFDVTKRVRYEWRTDRKMPFCELARELAEAPSGCAIVNLRKHASQFYDEICQYRCKDEVFLLSTDLCQAHREKVIRTVRERLAEGIPTLLISTQCIEAGVDLDFPILYRAFAPLEAIIQAAGRVNRNGKMEEGGRVIIFIPDVEGALYPRGTYYETAANCVLTLLSRHPIDCSDLSHIREYYEILYPYNGGDRRELTESIQNEDYEGTAKAYRIIENGGAQVIVPWQTDEEAVKLYEAVRERYDREGLTPGLMADARPITVTSFDVDSVKNVCQRLTFRSPENGELTDTGWYLLGISDIYDDKKGLNIQTESQSWIF